MAKTEGSALTPRQFAEVKDEVDEQGSALSDVQTVSKEHDELLAVHDDALDALGKAVADVKAGLADLADLRAQPWHVLSDIPDLLHRFADLEGQLSRLVKVVVGMAPQHENEIRVPPSETDPELKD